MPHVSIEYRVTEYSPKARDNLLTDAEQHSHAGQLRAKHLYGIFRLLEHIDIRRNNPDPTHNDMDELSMALSAVGELGSFLSDSLYCDVAELGDEVERITTFSEQEVST